jgi:NAD+ diphosphatase
MRLFGLPPEIRMSRPDLGPQPHLGFTGPPLDRAAERRDDVAAIVADPRSAVYVVCGDLVLAKKRDLVADPLFSVAEARAFGAPREQVFLGFADGAGRFGVAIDPALGEALAARDDLVVTDLRSIAVRGLVDAAHQPPLAEAKALLAWHARHRFCPNCGAPTAAVQAGWKRECPVCKTEHFPRTDPVVIMLVVDGDRCVLGRQARFAKGMWSCLAGFVEPGETIEDAVRREVFEEAGVKSGRVRYFQSQPWPFPMSLMIGCHVEALSTDLKVDYSELEDARWFSRAEVIEMMQGRHPAGLAAANPIAIAHHIIRAWVEGRDGGFD